MFGLGDMKYYMICKQKDKTSQTAQAEQTQPEPYAEAGRLMTSAHIAGREHE